MALGYKTIKNKEIKELTLLAFQEETVIINGLIAFFNIGITTEESIYIRLIDNEKNNYEELFSILYLQLNISHITNNIKIFYDWILARINYNQYHFDYNEDKSQIFFCYNVFNRNLGQNEPKKLIIDLKANNNLFIIKNNDKMNLLKNFNNQYKTSITLYDAVINLANKAINNQGLRELCQFELNASVLSLINNKISDLSSLNNDTFKKLIKLYLQQNDINDLKPLCNIKFENLIELRLNHNQINDINSFKYLKMDKIENLWLNNNNISDISVLEKVNFQYLIKLNLSKNNIKNILFLENVDFHKLTDLDLSKNNINNISVLEIELNSLEILNLSFNEIERILVEKKLVFPQLKKLDINNNNIKEIIINGRVSLPLLKKLICLKI